MLKHPIIIILSSAVLLIAPRLWVERIMKRHNLEEDESLLPGGELARELLDRHELREVRVESTDLGDHYDPETKVVRLTRDKLERKSLTAAVTAAHEVSHAIQDAEGYRPFVWRRRLGKLSQVTGQVGAVVLLSAPIAAFAARTQLPPRLLASAALAVLGTGGVAQIAALPAEWDASFRRALPLLREGYLSAEQLNDARKMLTACSLTYVGAMLVSVLYIWPWLPRRPGPLFRLAAITNPPSAASGDSSEHSGSATLTRGIVERDEPGFAQVMFEVAGESVARGWCRLLRIGQGLL